MKDEKIKDAVRAKYSQIAKRIQQTCSSSCRSQVNPLLKAEAVQSY